MWAPPNLEYRIREGPDRVRFKEPHDEFNEWKGAEQLPDSKDQ